MQNPVATILTVARTHRGYRAGYLAHYGRRLGTRLYRQARQSAAAFLRELAAAERRNQYFRHDSIILAPPG